METTSARFGCSFGKLCTEWAKWVEEMLAADWRCSRWCFPLWLSVVMEWIDLDPSEVFAWCWECSSEVVVWWWKHPSEVVVVFWKGLSVVVVWWRSRSSEDHVTPFCRPLKFLTRHPAELNISRINTNHVKVVREYILVLR